MIRDVQIAPVLDTAIISTGEVIVAPFDISDMEPSSGNGIEIQKIIVCETEGQNPGLLFVFLTADSLTGTYNVNSDPAWTDADMASICELVDIPSDAWIRTSSKAFVQVSPLSKSIKPNQSGKLKLMVLARTQYDAVGNDDLKIRVILKVSK